MSNEAVVIAIIQLLLTLAAATVAILPALLKMRAEKAKTEADTTQTLTTSALAMVAAWEERNKQWEARVQTLEMQVKKLESSEDFWKRGCYRLMKQLIGLGQEPCWDPNGVMSPDNQED